MSGRIRRTAGSLAVASLSLLSSGFHCGGEPVAVEPGRAFELHVGERGSVSGGDLTLTFLAVTEDSRCPKGEQCIQAGKARLSLEAAPRDGPPLRFELDTARASETEIGGYFITLLGLEPVRVSGRPISPQDYVARLSVGRASSAHPDK